MYKYPYGDSQQLNLDWILAKIKELEAGGSGGAADLEEVSNALIALSFNLNTQYRRYDYCYSNGKLYRCLSDTSGVFDPSAWQEALIGDDLAVLTRWINAIDAAAVVDVKFDTSGTNGKIQQKYHDVYHDVVEVDYTPVQNSKRPLSSNAGYELNGAITSLENSSASIDWAPSSGDTLLAFLTANITNRDRLPFSFAKRTNNTVTDVPTNLQSAEFTGVVFGSGDRISVLISKFGSGHDEVHIRNIYQNGFYGNWLAVNTPIISNISGGSLLTAGTHISIGAATYYKIGQLVCWELSLTTTGAVAVGEILVSGLNTPFYPANGFPVSFMYDQGNPNEIRLCRLNSSGNLESCVAISSSGINIRTTLVYAASA